MLIFIFGAISIACVWLVLRPLMLLSDATGTEQADQNIELLAGEKFDLMQFLETLEFERMRGLISESEYQRQKSKAEKRIALVRGENL